MLIQNRPDDSWKVVLRLHGVGNDASSETVSFAKQEFYQMRVQAAADSHMAAIETVWTLFRKPSYRKRMICAFLTMFGSESTGILVVYSSPPFPSSLKKKNRLIVTTDYSVLLYQGLGFKGSVPLLLAAAYVTVACVGNYINSLVIDRIGRVNLLREFSV